MNAILVSVDYSDLLSVTLPRNRKHFDRMCVVTSPADLASQRIARECGCCVWATDAFWRNGADFNKWLALEEGLDFLGRSGWLAILDADVLWPSYKMNFANEWCELTDNKPIHAVTKENIPIYKVRQLEIGNLYTPLRRMAPWPIPVPPESDWGKFPLHPQQREFAGYTQIFHANDPALGPAPWHQTDWRHAGGADSFFQAKWGDAHKVRPPFEVLHLGQSGVNWCGRTEEGRRKVLEYRRGRRYRNDGGDPFEKEKLGKS